MIDNKKLILDICNISIRAGNKILEYYKDDIEVTHKNDSSPLMAKKILGSNKIIGVSCGNNMRIASTYTYPYVKYISFGSAFKTKTKKNIKKILSI